MDWFFNGLNDFFQWSFRGMEKMEMPFNWVLIVLSSLLTIWWMVQMVKHPKEKG